MSNAPQNSPEKQFPTVEEVVGEIKVIPFILVKTLNDFLNARGFMLNMSDLKSALSFIKGKEWGQVSEILTQYRAFKAVEVYEGGQNQELQVMRGNFGKKAKKASGTRKGRAGAYDEFDA